MMTVASYLTTDFWCIAIPTVNYSVGSIILSVTLGHFHASLTNILLIHSVTLGRITDYSIFNHLFISAVQDAQSLGIFHKKSFNNHFLFN